MPWRLMGKKRYSSTILYLGTKWRSVISCTLRPLYSRENRRRYPPAGGCVDPRARLGDIEKRKILPCRDSNLGRPARSLSLYRLSYPDWNWLFETQSGRKFSLSHLMMETHPIPETLCLNKLQTTDKIQVTAMFVQSRRGMKIMIFWTATSCSLVENLICFYETTRYHIPQDDELSCMRLLPHLTTAASYRTLARSSCILSSQRRPLFKPKSSDTRTMWRYRNLTVLSHVRTLLSFSFSFPFPEIPPLISLLFLLFFAPFRPFFYRSQFLFFFSSYPFFLPSSFSLFFFLIVSSSFLIFFPQPHSFFSFLLLYIVFTLLHIYKYIYIFFFLSSSIFLFSFILPFSFSILLLPCLLFFFPLSMLLVYSPSILLSFHLHFPAITFLLCPDLLFFLFILLFLSPFLSFTSDLSHPSYLSLFPRPSTTFLSAYFIFLFFYRDSSLSLITFLSHLLFLPSFILFCFLICYPFSSFSYVPILILQFSFSSILYFTYPSLFFHIPSRFSFIPSFIILFLIYILHFSFCCASHDCLQALKWFNKWRNEIQTLGIWTLISHQTDWTLVPLLHKSHNNGLSKPPRVSRVYADIQRSDICSLSLQSGKLFNPLCSVSCLPTLDQVCFWITLIHFRHLPSTYFSFYRNDPF
jgi:hypothetical protein